MAAPKKSRSPRKTKAETQEEQPAPTVTEQREGEPRKDDRQSPEQPDQAPDQRPEQHVVDGGRSFRADVFVKDPHAVEKQRRSELDAEREAHNRRTGDASLA
jgi:hypothetical protein